MIFVSLTYLRENNFFSSINGHDSKLVSVLYGVPQGSVLDPLLFLMYINGLNQAIKFCKVLHFADDADLLHFSKSITKLNRYVDLDMKNLTNWLKTNKISLTVHKTELVILKGTLSGLRQFLATESPLKMMKNAFYFTSKALFVLKIFKFLS